MKKAAAKWPHQFRVQVHARGVEKPLHESYHADRDKADKHTYALLKQYGVGHSVSIQDETRVGKGWKKTKSGYRHVSGQDTAVLGSHGKAGGHAGHAR